MQNNTWQFIDMIGYDCGWGCRDYGCEDGPDHFEFAKTITALTNMGVEAKWSGDLGLRQLGSHDDIANKHDALPLVQESVTRLAQKTSDILKQNGFPVIIGGDHSSAIGTWSGVTSTLNMEGEFGLIWLDAHMDAHTPQTADQGKWGGWWHGMPVACLTGNGLPDFTQLMSDKVKIKPENITLIGIRSFEPGEEEYLKTHGITAYTMDDLEQMGGFQPAFDDALTRATNGTQGFGLSIDLDGFDPDDAPGVGTPEKHGLIANDVLNAMSKLGQDPRLKAMEIVEYNPHNGRNDITKNLITELITHILEK